MLAALAGPDHAARAWPAPGLAEALPLMAAVDATRGKERQGTDPGVLLAERRAALQAVAVGWQQGTRATLARSIAAEDGFRERLVRFWADHFTTIARSGRERMLPLTLVEDAIRPQLNRRFSDLLQAVTLHPAMLIYLDQDTSVGPGSEAGRRRNRGLNENLGRELMELHTLGVGAAYSQTDVREMAELLTGLGFDPGQGFVFRRGWAEPGAETVLDSRFGGKGLQPIRAALEMLATHPETARHIAAKLAVHFVADRPDADLVATLERAFLDSGGDLPAVYAALLNHPAAWAPLGGPGGGTGGGPGGGPGGGKVRQPYDFVTAGLKALGVTGAQVMGMPWRRLDRLAIAPLTGMGQTFLSPGGPNGWPEEAEAWITPQGLAARIIWAMDVPQRLLGGAFPDPVRFAGQALGEAAGAALLQAVSRAETRREAVGLVLASPEFNRR
ncbi:DUF1800 domain-containing protein [Fertoebacter nigrum]|uniref:DUF1800 domain-containing protein n=2 Tax=Fertoeibacter niger TaxID=2656921 RepID=A0A8X8GY99_9RHOB|nr:DUF1800 domain-containing protein [Fertoeibacter niger]